MKKVIVILSFCFIFCNVLSAQNIMKIEQHSFKSSIYGEKRSFRIALPMSAYPDVRYNVLFVLDADYTFDLIASTAIYLQTFDHIPPTAVVAIDYSTPGNRNDVGYDLSDNSLNSSGERFYNYMNTDLVRAVNKILPTSGFYTLVGHSYTASYLNYCIDAGNDCIKSYIPNFRKLCRLSCYKWIFCKNLQSQCSIYNMRVCLIFFSAYLPLTP